MPKEQHIAIVGGGAAGFFCAINVAINAKKHKQNVKVSIVESSGQYLKKVRISGGGRCNVTHNQFDVKRFVQSYPRGQRELLSPMQRFQAQDTIRWFEKQGVEIVPEADGRMFPVSNTSDTIIETYLRLVEDYKINLVPHFPVKHIEKLENGSFHLESRNSQPILADKVMIATGSSNGGYQLAERLGHTITERAPSLFSFKIRDELIEDLPGLSFEATIKMTLPSKKVFKERGPVLITHWGLSGPAILKLSAWAAREMKQSQYQARLLVNWLGETSPQQCEAELQELKEREARKLLKNTYPAPLPKRFWCQLLNKLQISGDKQWANLNKKELNKIVQALVASEFSIEGQNRFKDEFVECGGVQLREVDFRSMESKICPGLYFAGEVLDVDGITGGFNFQNAWTTAWIAAQAMIDRIIDGAKAL